MSNKIWDIQNLILDLRIFLVCGHGARYCRLLNNNNNKWNSAFISHVPFHLKLFNSEELLRNQFNSFQNNMNGTLLKGCTVILWTRRYNIFPVYLTFIGCSRNFIRLPELLRWHIAMGWRPSSRVVCCPWPSSSRELLGQH